LVSRENIKDYLNNKGEIEILAPAFAYEDESIKEIGNRFLQTPSNVLLIKRREDEQLVALITLHDLIRAQASVEE